MTWHGLALVAIGAAAGAPARYLIDRMITNRVGDRFPWGTLTVNLAGSGLLGVIAGSAASDALGSAAAAVIGAGFCGAFTTTSAFSWEVLALAGRGTRRAALVYAVLSVTMGVLLAALGFWLGAALA